ncbi:hypothetical protein D3C71_188400 [compost metagenome]
MLYLLKTPNGSLAVFDTFYHEFECLDLDPAKDLLEILDGIFENLSPRLLRCEIEHALNDLSPDGSDWPAHPEGLNRWEGVLKDIIAEISLEEAMELLEEIGMSGYVIPEAMADEARASEARNAAERVRYEAHAARPSPYVNTANDESVWADI